LLGGILDIKKPFDFMYSYTNLILNDGVFKYIPIGIDSCFGCLIRPSCDIKTSIKKCIELERIGIYYIYGAGNFFLKKVTNKITKKFLFIVEKDVEKSRIYYGYVQQFNNEEEARKVIENIYEHQIKKELKILSKLKSEYRKFCGNGQ
jgi:hypothetical protein